MAFLVILLAMVAQTGEAAFTGAEVSGSEVSSATIDVEVAVTLRGSNGPVVVHLLLPGEAEQVVPLARRSETRWGAMLELRRADWRIVFEDVASGVVSEKMTLVDIGLDPALLGILPAGSDASVEEDSSPALPAAIATFVGLVTLYAVWTLLRHRPGRHKP